MSNIQHTSELSGNQLRRTQEPGRRRARYLGTGGLFGKERDHPPEGKDGSGKKSTEKDHLHRRNPCGKSRYPDSTTFLPGDASRYRKSFRYPFFHPTGSNRGSDSRSYGYQPDGEGLSQRVRTEGYESSLPRPHRSSFSRSRDIPVVYETDTEVVSHKNPPRVLGAGFYGEQVEKNTFFHILPQNLRTTHSYEPHYHLYR